LAEAHHYLGAAYSELGLFAEAKTHIEKALALQPGNAATLFELGLLYARQEDRDRAVESFLQARNAGRDDSWIAFRMAEIHRYQKSVALAEAEYRRAIEMMPELNEARLQLGLLLLESARYGEAESALRELVERDPRNGEAHHQLALACDKLGRSEDARRHFERALELAPDSIECQLHYGNFLMQQGEREKGKNALLRFQELKRSDDRVRSLSARLELEPSNLDVKRELVRVLLELNRGADALREAERFLAIDPESTDLELLLEETRRRVTEPP
jgi:Flp pilus assembly protein TadD